MNFIMATTPLPRLKNINWLNTHYHRCNSILNYNYNTLLLGDSLVAGLSHYSDVWKRYFESLNSINCGIGGDRVQNVLWRCNNLPPSPSFKNIIILCGTNNIQCDSPEDVSDGILEIAQALQGKYKSISNIIVSGLLPLDHSTSIYRVYIKEINENLLYKCKQNGIKCINPSGWVSENGSLNSDLFYFVIFI